MGGRVGLREHKVCVPKKALQFLDPYSFFLPETCFWLQVGGCFARGGDTPPPLQVSKALLQQQARLEQTRPSSHPFLELVPRSKLRADVRPCSVLWFQCICLAPQKSPTIGCPQGTMSFAPPPPPSSLYAHSFS